MDPQSPFAPRAPQRIAQIGATGAVGRNALAALLASEHVGGVSILGRRALDPSDPLTASPKLAQHVVDLFNEATYEQLLAGHDGAICTLGVGEPSKLPRAEVRRIDVEWVVKFAAACKRQQVRRFSLMTAVSADPRSSVWYLKMKGELEEQVKALGFLRCSFFRPSMLLTKENRYGLDQALLLAIWPRLGWAMPGALRKYRGVRVEDLGRAIARDAEQEGPPGAAVLHWGDFQGLLG